MFVGGSVSGACGNSSPRTHRASRPLSAVFQSLQPPSLWKSRKSTSPLNQVDYNSHLPSVPIFHFKHAFDKPQNRAPSGANFDHNVISLIPFPLIIVKIEVYAQLVMLNLRFLFCMKSWSIIH